jgi:pilus assembly protein CpaC
MPQATDKAKSMTPFTRKVSAMKKGLITASLLGISVALSALVPLVPPAMAADQLTAAPQSYEDGRFVRMGVDKSIVVKLPTNAKDVVVGNPDIVDAVVRNKTTAYLFARKLGQTNVFFFDAAGEKILELNLEVAMDTTAIRKFIDRALPGNSITIDTANNNIVLGGVARNSVEAKTAVDLATQFSSNASTTGAIVNTMTVAGEDQVMLKVKVVEIQRDVLKQFGVDLGALLEAGKFAFKIANINPFANSLISGTGGYKAAYASGGTQIEGLIRAMEGDGLVRTLAEPNLTAMTGQQAKFLAGGEFPYELCRLSSGIRECTISFKNFGVELEFTPTVLTENRINLKIKTDVSELSSISSINVPTINRRSTETTLELPSGGSMMIAGLIKETTRQNINGTPGLKKLPILGTLFRSRDFVSNETELVIMVTPILVRPTDQGKLTSPDKGFNPPTDRQGIFFGRLNRVYGKGEMPEGSYNGKVGFIVE